MPELADAFRPRELHWVCHDQAIDDRMIVGRTDIGIRPSARSRYERLRKTLLDDVEAEWFRDATRRAQQTSARVLSEVDWQEHELLAPRAMGAWEGRSWEEIRAEDAVRAEAFWNRYDDSRAPGDSESLGAVLERAEAFLTGMGNRGNWERAIVVAAPEVIAAAVCSVLGIGLRSTLRFSIDPLSLTTVRHSWMGWQLSCLNSKP